MKTKGMSEGSKPEKIWWTAFALCVRLTPKRPAQRLNGNPYAYYRAPLAGAAAERHE